MNVKTVPMRVVDARTFQTQLGSLANTLALKVEREGPKLLKPVFAAADLCIMLRQSLCTYELFCFVNADERRKNGADWKAGYSASILPLIRCMIDCLYNITVILSKPGEKGYQFRKSGYKKALDALDADEKRYGNYPSWDEYVRRMRDSIHNSMHMDGLTLDEVNAVKNHDHWPTLGAYLGNTTDPALTPHKEFLRKLTLGFWREYSGMAHATFQGLLPTAMFYAPDTIPMEHRDHFENVVVERMIAVHVSRAAGILLCTLTEVQAHFHFNDARINQRLHEVWNALVLVPEIEDLHAERYEKLMKENGINPK